MSKNILEVEAAANRVEGFRVIAVALAVVLELFIEKLTEMGQSLLDQPRCTSMNTKKLKRATLITKKVKNIF